MAIRVRLHFDGKVLVPDEPVDLPVSVPLEVVIRVVEPVPDPADIERRLEALRRLTSRAVRGANIPDEALRRENMYEDRI